MKTLSGLRLELAESLFEFGSELDYQLQRSPRTDQLSLEELRQLAGLLFAVKVLNIRLDPSSRKLYGNLQPPAALPGAAEPAPTANQL